MTKNKLARQGTIQIHDHNGKSGKYLVRTVAGNRCKNLNSSVEAFKTPAAVRNNIIASVHAHAGSVENVIIVDYTKCQYFAKNWYALPAPRKRKKS